MQTTAVSCTCGHGCRSRSSACLCQWRLPLRRRRPRPWRGRRRGGTLCTSRPCRCGGPGPGAGPDVGGLLAAPLGPAALHGAPQARPGPNPAIVGLRFPTSRPGGRSCHVLGAVAGQNPRSGPEKNAAEGSGQEVLVRRALRGRRRPRRRQVQREVADRPGRREARLPRLHQRVGRRPDR